MVKVSKKSFDKAIFILAAVYLLTLGMVRVLSDVLMVDISTRLISTVFSGLSLFTVCINFSIFQKVSSGSLKVFNFFAVCSFTVFAFSALSWGFDVSEGLVRRQEFEKGLRAFISGSLCFIWLYLGLSFGTRNGVKKRDFINFSLLLGVAGIIIGISEMGLLVDNDEYTHASSAYMVAMAYPMYVYAKGEVKFLPFFITIAILFLSGKRGAMLLGALFSVVHVPMFLRALRPAKSIRAAGRYFFVPFILVVLNFLLGFEWLLFYLEQSALRLDIEAVVDSGGSGRVEFWSLIIQSQSVQDLSSLFLGNGFFATATFLLKNYGIGIMAHNDVLETLFSFGVIGCVVFIIMCVQLAWILLSCKGHFPTRFVSLLLMIVLFVRLFFAGFIYRPESFAFCLFLGFFLARHVNSLSVYRHRIRYG